jgi:hypothetical protein
VPRSPVASPEKGKKKEIAKEKAADRKGTVKSRMAKNGNGNLKKKKKLPVILIMDNAEDILREVRDSANVTCTSLLPQRKYFGFLFRQLTVVVD